MPTYHLRLMSIFFLGLLLTACGGATLGEDPDGFGGDGSGSAEVTSISITVGDSSPRVGATLRVIAELGGANGGNLSGRDVTFTILPTEQSVSVRSNASGRASADLPLPNRAGPVEVVAEANGLIARQLVDVRAGLADAVILEAFPDRIAPERQTSLRATVTDQDGNPVPNARVRFGSGNSGAFDNGANAVDATTNDGGVAFVSLTAVGTTDIPITVEVVPDGLQASSTVTVTSGAIALGALQLTALSSELPADGVSQTRVRALVTGTDGAPVQGATVAFTTSAGSMDSSAVTNTNGIATGTLTSSSRPGNATVSAQIGGLTGEVQVVFTAADAQNVRLSLAPSSVAAGDATVVRATARDAQGVPVAGERLFFDVVTNASGGTLSDRFVTTDQNGVATAIYTSGLGISQPVTDVLRVSGAANGVAAEASLAVQVRIASLELSSINAAIRANGSDQTTIRARLLDVRGNPIPGIQVTFGASSGVLSQTVVATGGDGVADTIFTAPTRSGEAIISASIQGATETLLVELLAGTPTNIGLSAIPPSIGPGGEVSLVAFLQDANGNPVEGANVDFLQSGSPILGVIENPEAETGSDGRATASFIAGNQPGVQQVVAQAAAGTMSGVASSSVGITIDAGLQIASNLSLTAGATSVAAGESPVRLEARVTDANGDPVVNRVVAFALSDGSFDTTDDPTALDPADRRITATTDSNGRATANFVAPAFVTNIRATANIGGLQQELTVAVTPGGPAVGNSVINANPQRIIADGASTSIITVLLNDAFGNPLTDGRNVRLITEAGQFIDGSARALTDGRAEFTLQSSDTANDSVDVRVQDLPTLSTALVFERLSNGDPAAIQFDISAERIDVAGVGGNEQTRIEINVTDSAGRPIDESGYGDAGLNNLRARFVVRPNGGEFLSGRDADGDLVSSEGGDSVAIRTTDGSASLSLQSGTLSGVVEIEFSVLGFGGVDFTSPGDVGARASLPRISIASGPPETIVFTSPNLGAIENLQNGNYRLRGKVDVTDRFGNVVPDGTTVNFSLMDAVVAHDDQGAIQNGAVELSTDAAVASLMTLRCDDPTPAGEADNCLPAQFNLGSTIQIENVPRGIETGDSVFLQKVQGENRKRNVSSLVDAGSLNVQTPFTEDAADVRYWAGASLRGATIAGIDSGGALVPGTGVVEDGIAEFRVTYPANVGSILTGCYGYNADFSYSTRDRRSAVPQSRQVIVSAESGQTVAANIAGDFCYQAIAGGRMLLSNPDTAFIASGATQQFSLTLRDGGDDIRLPYTGFACFVSDIDIADTSNFSVSVNEVPVNGLITTNVNGVGLFELTRTNPATDTAEQDDRYTITCRSGEISASFEVGPS